MITIIAAMSLYGFGIGYKNTLPWKLKADLKFFQQTTKDHVVIMGRKTFESLGKPLKDRINIVLTRTPSEQPPVEGVIFVSTIDEAIAVGLNKGHKDIFIIGGAEIYELALPYAERALITLVDVDKGIKFDAHFPMRKMYESTAINTKAFHWELMNTLLDHPKDEHNEYSFSVVEFLFVPKSPNSGNKEFDTLVFPQVPFGHYDSKCLRNKRRVVKLRKPTGAINAKHTLIFPANTNVVLSEFIGPHVRPILGKRLDPFKYLRIEVNGTTNAKTIELVKQRVTTAIETYIARINIPEIPFYF